MQHGAMADMAVRLDHRVAAGKTVHDTSVLQVGALFQDQAAEVAAQRCQWADVAARADDHVADQHRTGMHIGAGVNDRRDAVDFIYFDHLLPLPM